MQLQDHDSKYAELEELFRACAGQPADDTADKRSAALEAYLRHTWHTRPAAIAVVARQLRQYAEHPPGTLRIKMGEFFPLPDVGLPDNRIQRWMLCVAEHLERCAAGDDVPAPSAVPETHREWHICFPEPAQLLGGWYSQDMPDEFDDHDAALDD